MTHHWLRAMHLGPQNIVPITAERHLEHAAARRCLIDAGDFERRYELLKGNFLAWEDFCAQWDLRATIDFDHTYDRWAAVILEADRHIMNLLSTGRTYVDQVVRDFTSFGGEGHFAEKAKELMHAAYDRSFDYRFIYELRDRAQHRALPVDGIDGGIRPKAGDSERTLFYASKKRIESDRGKFKKRVLDEAGEKIDLRLLLRGYMTEMSKIHIALRETVEAECLRSRATINLAIKDYVSAQEEDGSSGNKALGLASVVEAEDSICDIVPLLLDWDDVRVKLAATNRFPIKF